MKERAFFWEIKDIIIQFAAAFDDVVIGRFDKNRAEKSTLEVRYVYSPKEKVLYDIVNKAQNLTLPVIAINITNIARDPERVFNKLTGFYHPETATFNKQDVKYTRQIGMPVPVNIGISMSVLTEYQSDMDQIISNFVPYNNPYIIISWKLPEEFGLGYTQEIRSEVLWDGNITMDYPIELTPNKKPRISADTSFIIKGWLFPAVPNDPYKNIFFINSNFYSVTGFEQAKYNYINKFTGYDEYQSLSGTNFVYPVSSGLNTPNMETISVSAAPQILDVFFSFANNVSQPYDSLTITSVNSSGSITLQGKMMQYTTAVLLSASTSNFYQNLTSLDFTYYPSITGYVLPTTNYQVLTPKIITVNLPALTAAGNFDIIVINEAGWGSTKNAGIQLSRSS
jgi:hypothetical protein